jgi:hypothetical protein
MFTLIFMLTSNIKLLYAAEGFRVSCAHFICDAFDLEQGTLYRILHASDGILAVLVVFSEHSTFTVEC